MTQEHPITPTPELVREWQIKIEYCSKRADREAAVAKIFQLGADQELEACRLWVSENCDIYSAVELIQCRRPKPPSLKEHALAALDVAVIRGDCITTSDALPAIRRALESLPD